MSKPATKAANSEFYIARMAATSFNDKMASREGAAEETGIDRTRLARIELGSINPYPEEVLLMSDAYDAPQLMNFYCSHVCPIGRQTVEPCEMLEFDRMMFRALGALQDAERISEMIVGIAKDGKVGQDEVEKMRAVMDYLQNVGAAADEMQLWIKKHMKDQ